MKLLRYSLPILISVFLSALLLLGYSFFRPAPRLAYVETGRLMVGFKDAAQIDKEIVAENEKWQAQAKILRDSVQVQVDRMTREYDKASPAHFRSRG